LGKHTDCATFMHLLAKCLIRTGRPRAAEADLMQVLQIHETACPGGDVSTDVYTSVALRDLAEALLAQGPGRAREAAGAARKADEIANLLNAGAEANSNPSQQAELSVVGVSHCEGEEDLDSYSSSPLETSLVALPGAYADIGTDTHRQALSFVHGEWDGEGDLDDLESHLLSSFNSAVSVSMSIAEVDIDIDALERCLQSNGKSNGGVAMSTPSELGATATATSVPLSGPSTSATPTPTAVTALQKVVTNRRNRMFLSGLAKLASSATTAAVPKSGSGPKVSIAEKKTEEVVEEVPDDVVTHTHEKKKRKLESELPDSMSMCPSNSNAVVNDENAVPNTNHAVRPEYSARSQAKTKSGRERTPKAGIYSDSSSTTVFVSTPLIFDEIPPPPSAATSTGATPAPGKKRQPLSPLLSTPTGANGSQPLKPQ